MEKVKVTLKDNVRVKIVQSEDWPIYQIHIQLPDEDYPEETGLYEMPLPLYQRFKAARHEWLDVQRAVDKFIEQAKLEEDK
jgi:hypothetical protein